MVLQIAIQLVFSLFVIVLAKSHASLCPEYCRCDKWHNMNRVYCIDKKLTSIHAGIPKKVEVLNLSNNSIASLQNYEFKDLDLLSIRNLDLQGNRISNIGIRAFSGMEFLRILDLSRNHLHYLLKSTFDDIPGLTALYISKNRLGDSVLELSLPALQILDISSCHFGYLESHIFSQLPALQEVNLSNNQLIGIDFETIKSLHGLRKIDFSRNPWICNGKTMELEAWLRKRNILFNQLCPTSNAVKRFEQIVSMMETEKTVEMNEEEEHFDDILDLDQENDIIITSISDMNKKLNYNDLTFDHTLDILKSIPSFWTLVIGFLSGILVTLISLCLWVSRCCKCWRCGSCCRPTLLAETRQERILQMYRRRRRSIRLSNTYDGQTMELLVETPPPPYRHGRYSSTSVRYNELL